MMSTTLPTRQQVERAQPLDFDQPRAKRQELGFTIKVTVNNPRLKPQAFALARPTHRPPSGVAGLQQPCDQY